MKPRRWLLSILWLGMALVLVGCAKIHVTTKINSDGSGENVVSIGLDTRQVEQGSILWTSLSVNVQDAVKAGAQAQEWREGRYEGYKLTYRFASLDKMSESLVQSTTSRDAWGMFTEVNASMNDEKGNRFSAKGDFTNIIAMGQELSFTLITPGRIVTYTEQLAATQPSPNQITWDIMKLQWKRVELTAVSEPPKATDFLLYFGVLAACLIVIVVILVLRKARQRAH